MILLFSNFSVKESIAIEERRFFFFFLKSKSMREYVMYFKYILVVKNICERKFAYFFPLMSEIKSEITQLIKSDLAN